MILQQPQQFQFDAEPQVSHPKYRDQEIYEDLTDIPDDESKIKIDFYVDRPPTPEYKPIPKGVDVSTQIESYEPDLFDYKLEVEPVLQVLVGKSIEQARMELYEESEAIELKQHKARFEKKRNAELMTTQRMEAAYIRRKDERERRILQHQLYQESLKLSQQKFISRQLSKNTLRGVKNRILNDLENLGLLKNDHLMELQLNSLPWFINRIQQNSLRDHHHHEQFIKLLDEVQLPIQGEHSRFYQIEINRRNVILAERERVRIEIEERKKRKAEIKRRRAIKEKREIQRSALYNNTLAKAEAASSIFTVNIFEEIAEIGVKGVVLPFDLFLLIAETLDLIVGSELDQLDEQIISTIWMDILHHKVQQFVLNLNPQLQQQIQDGLIKMDEDLFQFEKIIKQQLIEQILEQLPFWANQSSQRKAQKIRPIILQKLWRGLLEIYFKSVNYKEPALKTEPKLKTEEQVPQDQDPAAEPKQPVLENLKSEVQEEYVKPEITQHDLDMVEARKKIQINYPQGQREVNAIVNLLIPFYLSEEQQQEQQQKQQQPEQIEEPAKPVGKWDFDPKTIDIYDGEQPLIQEGQKSEADTLFTYQFQEPVQVNDQRALEFSRFQIYQFIREKLESFMNVPEYSNLQYQNEKLQIPNVPIYDYEV